jgi:hypothetical protein
MSALSKLADPTAIYGLSSILARFLGILLIGLWSSIASHGQYAFEGEYTDGQQRLLLKPDSTFSYSYHFCSYARDRAWGTWSVQNSLLHLTYVERMDTFIMIHARNMVVNEREYTVSMEERTLLPAMDEKPVTIYGDPSAYCCATRGPRPATLFRRKDRLYTTDSTGKILHTQVRSNNPGWLQKRRKRTFFVRL